MFARKSYTLDIETTQIADTLAPTFTVIIDHSTFALSESEKYVKASQGGFCFSMMDANKIKISITPQESFDQLDKLFRSACAMLTRYKFTTRECQEVIQAYEKHLSRYGVESEHSTKKSRDNCNSRSNHGVC